MARLDTYTCDECGAIKRELNHWFVTAQVEDKVPYLMIGPWEKLAAFQSAVIRHYCSVDCTTRAVKKWLAPK